MASNAFSSAQPSTKATEKFGEDSNSEERQAVSEECNQRVAHEDNLARLSKLNPDAEAWEYWSEYREKVDQRTLFFTFSEGHPIMEYQIKSYFTRVYGDCLEDVIIDKRPKYPLFGKLIFKRFFLPVMILGGRKEAKFTIAGRSLWCKPYCPPKIENVNKR